MLAPLLFALTPTVQPNDWVVYQPAKPNGKQIVFLSGDEEYRSEEGLPQLAKILALRHGFRCTVLFSVNGKGEIDPDEHHNEPGLEALDTADLVVMLLRFREWPDDQMKHFDAYVKRGKPIIALRTSTHAFDLKSGPYEMYGWQSKTWPGGFGRHVLGETWVSHWGNHGQQGTRGIIVARHPVLKDVQDIFVTTDVYEAHPPEDCEVLVRGQVVDGLHDDDQPANIEKQNSLGQNQPVNDPMMPIVWTRGKTLTTTMGAATDLLNEGLRRLIVNGAYWMTGLDVPAKADVTLVGDYKPSPFGFGGYKKGVKPGDLASN
ncbi:MAG TPA: ThuA domain-containing protein [Fimbriimonadaceae bacterium]|nr:ThuA domain-containing protein [Fimbriimonadaceae bacterium]